MSAQTPPVNHQIDWLLETLRDGAAGLSAKTITERFSPAFLKAIPAEAVAGQIQKMAATLDGVSHTGFSRPPTGTQANVSLTTADGPAWVVPISVEHEDPHRITGLSFAPVPVPDGVILSPAVDLSGNVTNGTIRTDGLYDIDNGRQMYLSSVGEGEPTVILESGLGDNAGAWFGIESALSQFMRVCTYDRPGAVASASTPAALARTGMDVAEDLHALLHTAGIPGPYILVGHSIGGVFARVFAHAWPDDVAGIVLVDSSHDDQISRIRQILSPALWEQMEPIFLPDPALAPEGIDLPATLDAVRAARAGASLPGVPLVVISAGLRRDPAILPEGWPIEDDFRLWLEMQADLATLTPGARHVIAEKSGHYVHQTEPELVIDAIRQMVMALR